MMTMRRLEDLEVVRVLDLCVLISRIRPNCTMALLPEWAREETLSAHWRAALDEHQNWFDELSAILNK